MGRQSAGLVDWPFQVERTMSTDSAAISTPTFSTAVGRWLPASLPAWFAVPNLYSGMLGDRASWLVALLLTLTTYGIMNTWMLWQIDADYRTRVLADLRVDPAAQNQAVQRLYRRLDLPEQERTLSSLLGGVLNAKIQRPASEHFIALAQQTGGLAGEKNEQAKFPRLVKDEFTGRSTGLRLFVVTITPTTGENLVSRWEQSDPTAAAELQSEKNSEKRKLLVRFGDLVGQEMTPSLRALARMNGWIQWWTVLIAFATMAMAARRWWAAQQRSRGEAADADWQRLQTELQADQAIADPPTRADAVRTRLTEVRARLDERPYSSLGFLLGLLPSLGFLGTVWGMGAALLDAEGLFTAADKQHVIHSISTQLGFAFDTTLVALIASMVAGLVVVGVRSQELHWLQELEQRYS